MARATPSDVRLYNKSVFLNAPLDAQYKPLLDAILFCIHACGYIARMAPQEVGGRVRIARIFDLIRASRLSIHDLSRVEEPRLNMAFECGICFGAKEFGRAEQRLKDLLILDSERHRFQRTMSDIGGQDALAHDNNPMLAIHCVRNFLAHQSSHVVNKGGVEISARYDAFRADLPRMCEIAEITTTELASLDYLPDLITFMIRWIKMDA